MQRTRWAVARTFMAAALLVAGCASEQATPPPTTVDQPVEESTPPPTTLDQPVEQATPLPLADSAPPATRDEAAEVSTPGPAEPAQVEAGGSWVEPLLEEAECPSARVEVSCFEFTVAADRSDPSGGLVVLPVYVVHATGDSPQSDPIVIPGGGPGFPATDGLEFVGQNPFLAERDVVLYDQRGTGLALPSLNCPESEAAFIASLTAADEPASEAAAIRDGLVACLERLEASDIDLTDYTTEVSARDLDELRQALGYEQWNLFGVSYGGRLSLTSMRRFPEGIRSVVLDSPVTSQWGGPASVRAAGERGLVQLADDCSASLSCANDDLLGSIGQLVERYNAEPVVVDVPVDGGTETLIITGNDMVGGLFDALYVTPLIPALPFAINQLEAGETAVVNQLAPNAILRGTDAAEAMTVAMNCADTANLDYRQEDTDAMQDPGWWSTVMSTQFLCPLDWPSSAPDFNDAVTSELPVVVIAGRYDPITSPGLSEDLITTLPNATFIYVGNGGHGLIGSSPCTTGIVDDFLADPTALVNVECVAEIPATAFG